MSLDQRSTSILTRLVSASSYVSTEELAKTLSVSKRTVYYDIQKINYWLNDVGLSPIHYVRSTGFYLTEETKQSVPGKIKMLKTWHYGYSPKERKAWLALRLFTSDSKLWLEDLQNKNFVSRNTTLEDLKKLKGELIRYHLALHSDRHFGYSIDGKEKDIRKALVLYFSQISLKAGWMHLFSEVQFILNNDTFSKDSRKAEPNQTSDLQIVNRIIAEFEGFLGIHYTDDVLYSLSAWVLFFIKRFMQGKEVRMNDVEKEVIGLTKEYQAARQISTRLEQAFRVNFPQDEVYYMTTYLLGARVNDFQQGDIGGDDILTLREVMHAMVEDFQKYACFIFQDRVSVEKNLLIHLKPAFYRVKYGIEMDNPLADTVRKTYEDIFNLTKRVITHFERAVGKKVSEDEIAFIAMHFGGWMRREGTVPEQRGKVWIVCASGVGTSRILQNQLEDLFPSADIEKIISSREYEKLDLTADFVITTTQIPNRGKPVFLVNPILSEPEKANLFKSVHSMIGTHEAKQQPIEGLLSIIRKYAKIENEQSLYREMKQFLYQPALIHKEARKPMLDELLVENHICFTEQVENWEDAIRLASAPLIADQSITPQYVQAMIDSIHELGPYIVVAPQVAIPHARPEFGVCKVGVSLLRIKEGINFSTQEDDKVHLIFVLAALDNDLHLKALSQLTSMLSENDNIQKLITARTAAEITKLIGEYSK